MITVYGAPPTRALRVLWMLEEMGLPYEVRPVDFASRMENADFIAANPVGAFPAIRDGDVRMMESCAILEYLGVKYGPTPLAPQPGEANWPTFLSYLHFGEASLTAPMNVTIASRFFAPDEHKANWGAQFAVDNFARKSGALVQRLKQSPYVAGPDFTAADISCGYAIGLAMNIGAGDKLDPALKQYLGKLTERPAYKKAAAPEGQRLPTG
ncbi:MAG TPA: glutathione S-transferase family protein [Caulobacteraceae bacterium]|nr:glutathione S-transferase family protein [Caulobacteraceae bacterium]